MKKFAKRLLTSVLAAAVALTTVVSSDMTALAAEKKATKIKNSTYTSADLIWEDNFDGDALNTKYWNYEAHEPGWVNAEWQKYPSQEENEKTGNIYVKDGKLTIQAKKEKNADGTYSYTSGRVNTQNKVDTKYGRFEARIKMPSGKGFLPAFWMMPTNENLYGQWPKCGEIDITEVHGSQPDVAYSTLHFGDPHGQRQNTYSAKSVDFSKDFHTYACEWEPGEIRFYIDNKLFYTEHDWFSKKEGFDDVTYPAPFDQPFYIILNLAVGGSWVGYPDETTEFGDNAQMVVDYVKVYQKKSYKENVKKPENTVKLRKPDKSGNYVVNSNFAKAEKLNDGKNWEFMLAGTGDASAEISKKALHITTKNAGDLDYSVQVVQPNIPMEQGYQYTLSFDAYADENRTMITGITAPDNGYVRYFNDTKVDLTTKKKTYKYTFDMKDATDANGRVEFNLGNQGSTAGVHITNVKVVKGKKVSTKTVKSVRPDGNYVYNGEFQEGENRLNYWTVKKAKGATVKVTNTNNVRVLKATVPASVKKASDVTAKQTKIAVKGGKSYVLSFDAKRTGAKNQTMIVKIAGQTYKVKLTGSMKNYKFDLKPAKGTKNATLEFQLGTKGTTCIDNVRIMENGLIINGDFSAGMTGFEAWANNPSDVSYVVDTLKEDSAFSMDIKDTGDQDWHVQLKQTGVKLEQGQTYKISFKAKASIDRDIKFAFQRNGLKRKTADGAEDWTVYFEDGQIPVTKEWKTYSAVFQMKEATDTDTSMSFSLGAVAGRRITDKHTVLIDDIALEKTNEKVPEKKEDTDDALIKNGTFDKGLAPFITWAHDSAKWESGVDSDKSFYATITNTGTQDWHVQLKQENIKLEKGKYYKLSFRAKSDMDRKIKYAFQRDGNKHGDDWTVYFDETDIEVSKDWKTYTTVFKMEKDSDNESSFSFNLGAVGKQITEKHTVMIDDVVLVLATEAEQKDAKSSTSSSSNNSWYDGSPTNGQSTQTGTKLTTTLGTLQDNSYAKTTSDSTGVKVGIKDLSGGQNSVTQEYISDIPTTNVEPGANYSFATTIYSPITKMVTIKAMNGSSVIKQTTGTITAGSSKSISLNFTGQDVLTPSGTFSTFSLCRARLNDVTVGASESGNVKFVVEMGKHEGENSLPTASADKPIEIKITTPVTKVESIGLLKNADFSVKSDGKNADNWVFYAHEGLNIDATATYSDNQAKIDIKNLGDSTDQWSDWQIHLKQSLILVEGHKYKISCKLSSTENRQMKVDLLAADIKNNPPVSGNYNYQMKDVTPESKTFDATVTCNTGAKKGSAVNGLFRITMGKIKEDANTASTTKPSVITISDVSVIDLTPNNGTVIEPPKAPEPPKEEIQPQPTNKNLIENGDFTGGDANWVKEGTPNYATASFTDGKAAFNITDVGTADHNIKLKQDGLTIEKGEKYKVSFKIKSTEARTVKWSLMNSKYDWYAGQDIALNANEEYTVDYTTPNPIDKDSAADIAFAISMGKIEGKETPVSTIEIDDVSVMKLPEGSENPGDGGGNTPVVEDVEGFGNYIGEPALKNSRYYEDGEIHYVIADEGVNKWDVQLQKNEQYFTANTKYKVSFSAKTDSTNDKIISYSIQNSSYTAVEGFDSDQNASLSDTYQSFEYEFTSTLGETGQLKFNIGALDSNTYNVYFKDIKVEEVTSDTNLLRDVKFDKVMWSDQETWNCWGATGSDYATSYIKEGAGIVVVRINSQCANSYDVQFMQKMIKLETGKKYELSFDVKVNGEADEINVGTIKIAAQNEDGSSWYGGTQTSAQKGNTYNMKAEINMDTKETNTAAVVLVELGKLNADTEVEISNPVLKIVSQ